MYRMGLGVFIFLACLANIVWIHHNAAPPRMWDDASYLGESAALYQTLRQEGLSAFLAECGRPSRGGHPPALKVLPLFFYMALQPGTRPALYAYTLLIPVFCIYLFLLTRTLLGHEKPALLAVVITGLFPITYGLWRNYMSEFGLTVALTASLYHLIKSEGFRVAKHALLFGLWAGVGLLFKVLFILFMAGPLGYVLVRGWRAGPSSEGARRRRHLLLPLLATALVAGPFYFKSGPAVLRLAMLTAHDGEFARRWGMGPAHSPRTVVRYWVRTINFGLSVYFAALLAFLLLLGLRRRRPSLSRPAGLFLGAWFLFPFLVGTFAVVKDYRHMLPIYPVLGIWTAARLAGSLGPLPKRRQWLILAFLSVYPVYQFLASSFDTPWAPRRDLRLGPFCIAIKDLEMASLLGGHADAAHLHVPGQPGAVAHRPVSRSDGPACAGRVAAGPAPRGRVSTPLPHPARAMV